MGAWGYGPFDSDGALDLLDNECGRLLKKASTARDLTSVMAYAGAAMRLQSSALSDERIEPILARIHRLLPKDIRDSGWDNDARRVKAVKAFVKALQKAAKYP